MSDNLVTLSVSSIADVRARMQSALSGMPQGSRISFASPDLLWRVLTRKRWELLQAMTGQGPMSIREAARRVGRDVKAVHGDMQALIKAGIVDRSERGVEFPYDGVHVDFTLGMAA